MISEDDVHSTQAPLSDRLDAGIQIGGGMPTLNLEDIRDPDQYPDNPLHQSGNANVSQPEGTAEPYVPWLGDTSQLGIIPRFQWRLFSLGSVALMMAISIWAVVCIVFSAFGPSRYIEAWAYFVSRGAITVSGLINWAPAIGVYYFLLCNPSSNKMRTGMIIAIGVTLFGALSWAYYALVSNTNIPYQQFSP